MINGAQKEQLKLEVLREAVKVVLAGELGKSMDVYTEEVVATGKKFYGFISS